MAYCTMSHNNNDTRSQSYSAHHGRGDKKTQETNDGRENESDQVRNGSRVNLGQCHESSLTSRPIEVPLSFLIVNVSLCWFKVSTQHFKQVEFWTLPRPLQHLVGFIWFEKTWKSHGNQKMGISRPGRVLEFYKNP